MKDVTQKEFNEFLDKFPTDLVFDMNGICDPMVATYNDFTNGKIWPESIVAQYTHQRDNTKTNFKIKDKI